MDKEKGKECLLLLARIMDEVELPFFLSQGTALGAYRDNGFTPSEEDIDFGFLQEQFTPLAGELASVLIGNGFEIHTINLPFNVCRTIVCIRDGIKADLVSFVPWKIKRFATRPIGPGKKPYSIVHDRWILELCETVDLFGRQFFVPSPIETYLELEYGDDWKTPRPDHISRTRVYGFVEENNIPNDYLDS